MMLLPSFIKNSFKKGFTLLETLASVAILTITIIGPLGVIITSSSYARQTKDNIIATYLAEEAIELLQNQFDSIYIYCKQVPGDAMCTPASATESIAQTSWRVFKERFADVSGPSCYESQKPYGQVVPGCNFDYSSMVGAPTEEPVFYAAGDKDNCAYLTEDIRNVTVTIPPNPAVIGSNSTYVNEKRKTYKCKNAANAQTAVTSKAYTRSLSIKQYPTFEGVSDGGPSSAQYNDDLLITSTVSFKSFNGTTRTIEVARFMHSRP